MSDVSRETTEMLDHYAALLLKWNKSINLIAKSTMSDVKERHIQDSFQIAEHVEFGKTWLDMGSGGGLPAIVLAIAAKQAGHQTKFTLVESDQRKCAFLRTASLELGLNTEIVAKRVEGFEHSPFDHISARALAPLHMLLQYANPFVAPDSTMIFPKGQNHLTEVAEARKSWTFDVELIESSTQASSSILIIRNLK